MESRYLYVHRCNWCGKRVTENSESLKVIEDISIICDERLDWKIVDGKVNILELKASVI